MSLLGASMHTRPASFIPILAAASTSDHSINPLTSLTRSAKASLTVSEKELLSIIGFILGLTALSTIVLCTSLRWSKSGLTSRTTDDGKVLRKQSAEVGESISRIVAAQDLWQFLGGVHVLVCAIIVAGIYLYGRQVQVRTTSTWGLLANDVAFTMAMSDMLFFGYIYTVIKEERRQVMEVRQRRSEEDEEDETNRLEVR